MSALPQRVDEPNTGRMEVEEADRRSRRTKAVLDVRRDGDERAGPAAMPSTVEEELDLAFEDVERIGVIGVGVRVDALEVGRERGVESLDIRKFGEDAMPVLPDPIAFVRPDEIRLAHCCRS